EHLDLTSFPTRRSSDLNLFNAGLEQAFGKYLVVTADYYWKYTKPDYDFGVLFSTPLTFPIQWRKSKIDGVAARVSVPNFHGLKRDRKSTRLNSSHGSIS